MTRKRTSRVVAVAALAAVFGPYSWAGTGSVTGYVKRLMLISDDRFGGCMAELTVDPSAVLPACRSDWVSFSCSGHFADQLRALRMYDQAQMAFALSAEVEVRFTDDSLHNGYCVAYRIDVIK